jgi:hypothetical protein
VFRFIDENDAKKEKKRITIEEKGEYNQELQEKVIKFDKVAHFLNGIGRIIYFAKNKTD